MKSFRFSNSKRNYHAQQKKLRIESLEERRMLAAEVYDCDDLVAAINDINFGHIADSTIEIYRGFTIDEILPSIRKTVIIKSNNDYVRVLNASNYYGFRFEPTSDDVDVTLTNIAIYGTNDDGFHFSDTASGDFDDIIITNCFSYNNDGDGIEIESATIDRLRILRGSTNYYSSIYGNGGDGISIEDSTIDSLYIEDYDIYDNEGSGVEIKNVEIDGTNVSGNACLSVDTCDIYSNGGDGIRIVAEQTMTASEM